MEQSKRLVLQLLLLAGILSACDTTLNIKSPASSYFIKYFGANGSQVGTDFVVNPDGTFVLFGTTRTGDTTRFYLVKADAKGNVLFETIWPKGNTLSKCQARDVELTSDGRIVVLGNRMVFGAGRNDYDIYVATFQQVGNGLVRTDSVPIGFPEVSGAYADEDATTVTPIFDGFIVAGSSGRIQATDDISRIRDCLFVRLNNDLTKYDPAKWLLVPSYGQSPVNVSTKIIQLADSSFSVFGYSRRDSKLGNVPDFNFWVFALNKKASPSSELYTPGTNGTDEKLFSIAGDNNGGYLLAGLQSTAAGDEIYFTKLKPPPFSFDSTDAQVIPPGPLLYDLGKLNTALNAPYPSNQYVSVSGASKGFLFLTNDTNAGNSNIFLMKVYANGSKAWGSPVYFGGAGDDFAGEVKELPDGKIAILGTMTVGQASVYNTETKMVLIKVNSVGQFAD